MLVPTSYDSLKPMKVIERKFEVGDLVLRKIMPAKSPNPNPKVKP